ncbi:MAG: class I SAM-dependent methyltransferase [Planctomycetes bacterium]|nr:class I SAM-dependent methyltransferase [Planctomycetota bacterium]
MTDATPTVGSALLERVRAALCCPLCRQSFVGPEFSCSACGVRFALEAGVPIFLTEPERRAAALEIQSDPENAFKNFFKRWPRAYQCVAYIVSPILVTGMTAKKFLRRFSPDDLMLNVGSGPTRLHPSLINVDLYNFPRVDIVSLGERLPFLAGSFDVVCCEEMLEHVPNPQQVVAEMVRVTKVGGYLYLGVPFVFPLHPSPRDYTRWSVDGLRSLLPDCEMVERGVTMGPTSAMLVTLTSWLATVFSFGFTPLRVALKYLFMLLFNPIKLLDYLYARLPGAEEAAACVYLVAQKRREFPEPPRRT